MINPHDFSTEFEAAKKLAHQAGDIMRKHFATDIRESIKEDSTPLTVADTQINTLVLDTISTHFPSHGIVAEEGSHSTGQEEFEWICDPIDGTIPYTIRIPCSIFSLALYRNKQPIFGVMYDPYKDILLHAFEGSPAFANDRAITTRSGDLTAGDVVGINTFIKESVMHFDCTALSRVLNERQIRTEEIHSICYYASLVASGHLKCACTPAAFVWDRAASDIIVRAAGGVMLDEHGNPLDVYTSSKYIVISNKECSSEMLNLAREYIVVS